MQKYYTRWLGVAVRLWHRLEEKETEHTRFLKGSRALDEESAVPSSELCAGAIDKDEYNYTTAFYNGLKVCRDYERGIAETPAADDGNRALNDKCFLDILYCTCGHGCETWYHLEEGSKDRYSALLIGHNETFVYTQTNLFYGIPKYLCDQVKGMMDSRPAVSMNAETTNCCEPSL